MRICRATSCEQAIAKPLLLVMTPIGVAWGLVEAARFHWWLAVLMAVLLAWSACSRGAS